MTPPTDVRKRLYLLAYAAHSIRRSHESCNLLLSLVSDTSHPLYYPLVTAIHTLYSRPFYVNRGAGSLEKELVPASHAGAHRFLVSFRDKVFAHSEIGSLKEYDAPLNLLTAHVYEKVSFTPVTPSPRLDGYDRARECIAAVHLAILSEIDRLVGEWRFCFEGKRGEFWVSVDSEEFLAPRDESKEGGRILYSNDPLV